MSPDRSLQVATWILSQLAPKEEREPIAGDLAEEYALRANGASRSAALKWCLQQVLASAPALLSMRLARIAWISAAGVAVLAYAAVGVIEYSIRLALSSSPFGGVYGPASLALTFLAVVAIGYAAARIRRGAATILGGMMLLAVTAMTLSAREIVPGWYRLAYFLAGPCATFIGARLQSLRQR